MGTEEFASDSKDILTAFYLDTTYLQIWFCGGLRQNIKLSFKKEVE